MSGGGSIDTVKQHGIIDQFNDKIVAVTVVGITAEKRTADKTVIR